MWWRWCNDVVSHIEMNDFYSFENNSFEDYDLLQTRQIIVHLNSQNIFKFEDLL